MRVLYVDHTTRISGAQRSLLDLLHGLPEDIHVSVASPPGPLRDAVMARGVPHVELPDTTASLRLHPRHTTTGAARLVATAVAIRRAARRLGADVAHANTLQAGLAAGLAGRAGGPPVVAHVRDCLPDTMTGRLVRRWIRRTAEAVVANSAYSAECFGPGVTHTISPAIDVAALRPDIANGEAVRTEFDIPPHAPVLAIVAQITPWKGQTDAVEILAGVREQLPEARLLIVGEAKFVFAATRYDNTAYLRRLHQLVEQRGLVDAVTFTGEREDVRDILAATDVLLVPSWEEPFGRAVIEASAMEVPVVATSVGGPAEVITDGVDGLLLPPRSPATWVPVVADLLRDPRRRARMGREARRTTASRFTRERNARETVAMYETILKRS